MNKELIINAAPTGVEIALLENKKLVELHHEKVDASFAVGDLFTVEPGLYHKELRGGVRLEQNFWLTADGLQRLSSYPLAL